MKTEIQRGLPGLADDAELVPPGEKAEELDATARPLHAWPAWYTPSNYTRRKNAQVAAGRHPFGMPLGPKWSRCGDCDHARSGYYHTRRYWKCALVGETRGPATDLRKRWRGCERFEPKSVEPHPI
jgi:hypothetical protein